MKNLLGLLRTELADKAYTENGAVSYASTGDALLDYFYHTPARRGNDNTQAFAKAFRVSPLNALKSLFYIRDIRGGQGERESFRQGLRWLYTNELDVFHALLPLVPEYGRWDDILEFVSDLAVVDLVSNQFFDDILAERPSLLGKWMPSENASSAKTKALAYLWMNRLDMSPRDYRKALVLLRRKINVVERQMCAGDWAYIEYSHVPSKAGFNYRHAFPRHDFERYDAYIKSVLKGEKKIHSATLFPHEIVHQVLTHGKNATLEAQWQALPNYAETNKNVLVLADVSSSMYSASNGGPVPPIQVSIALALYLSERTNGAFKNTFMTFAAQPKLIELHGKTLYDRVMEVYHSDWGGNTNIQAAFDVILNVAQRNNLPQSELPEMFIIVSDMEFDKAEGRNRKPNMNVIKNKFKKAGYQMPKLVFWNVDSATEQVPALSDEKDVYLVSGFSPSVFKVLVGGQADPVETPLEMMFKVLNQERYKLVEETLRNI